MLDPLVYRAAFIPALLALALVAFSLGERPRPIQTTLSPDAFDGAMAFSRLQEMASAFPERRPGGSGDQGVAAMVERSMRAAGFRIVTREDDVRTIDGRRTVRTVIGTRTGQPGPGIVVVAHRDAAGRGARAELSGTAALDELARVYGGRTNRRTLTLVSTSGGSGGNDGAAAYARTLSRADVDAVLVLGDLASEHLRKPWVLPWSNGAQLAPVRLRRTMEAAVRAETGQDPGGASATQQVVRLALPFAVGEEGPFNARGLPAVALQASGEQGPATGAAVSAARLEVFGRAALRTISALDNGPPLDDGPGATVITLRRELPAWAVRLLVGALLLPALAAAVDGLARTRRHRHAVAAWVRWILALAAPFALALLVARFCELTGIVDAPGAPVASGRVPIEPVGLILVVAAFVAAWWGVRPLEHLLGVRGAPDGPGPAAALAITIAALAAAVWLGNPYAAALLVPPAHCWLIATHVRMPRWAALLVAVVALAPVVVVLVVYAGAVGLSAGEVPWSLVLVMASGQLGLLSMLVLAALAACALAAVRLVLRATEPTTADGASIRGPAGHVGPGALGDPLAGMRPRR